MGTFAIEETSRVAFFSYMYDILGPFMNSKDCISRGNGTKYRTRTLDLCMPCC